MGEATKRPRLFVSHHSSKAEVALQVEAALARHDVDCWMAPRDVDPGEAFDTAIQKAIDECSAVLLLFCAQSDKSRHVKRELILADSASKAILPLRLEDVVPHDLAYHLASAQWIDWLARRDEAMSRIAAKAHRLDGLDQSADVVAAADALHAATILQASRQEEPARMPPPPVPSPPASSGMPVWVFAVIGLVLVVGVLAGMLLTRGGEESGPAPEPARLADVEASDSMGEANSEEGKVEPEIVEPTPVVPPMRASVSPSFNCSKAASRVEKMICSDDELALLDRELARSFRELRAVAGQDRAELEADQRNWRVAERDACGSVDCIASVTRDRVALLNAAKLAIMNGEAF
ncbi:TIR domain-containing protein [Parerythrobacter lacustris]|uniref:TIR domain-containing protein n=1 Tax=Parerythrobacter lacustris TaxID=2969984 RepID=A0ABT1XR91_9SPHN|nr:TIR domain-containing protein [Parerythrobacter lacustris]MCR2833175.1 TIR domain-containing protein [Parerythrobacter lacustris]